jgi:hypothetical protein
LLRDAGTGSAQFDLHCNLYPLRTGMGHQHIGDICAGNDEQQRRKTNQQLEALCIEDLKGRHSAAGRYHFNPLPWNRLALAIEDQLLIKLILQFIGELRRRGSRESRPLAHLSDGLMNIGSDVLEKQRHNHHPNTLFHRGWVAKSQTSIATRTIR